MLPRSGKRPSVDSAGGPQKTDFEALLGAVPDALLGVDRAGVIRFVNARTESLFGYARGDLVGLTVETLVPECALPVRQVHVGSHAEAPLPLVLGRDQGVPGRRRDGTEFPVEVTLSPMGTGQARLVIAAVRDLTSPMAVEVERQSERERSRANSEKFFELSLDLLCICGADGLFKQLNPAWTATLGYQLDELVGQPFASFIHPDDHELSMEALAQSVGGASMVAVQNRYRCKDGSYRWVLWNAAPLPDEGLVFAVGRDNTEQRKAFEAAQRMAAIVEFSGEAIVGATFDGIVTSFNPAAEKMFGYHRDEIIGKSFTLLSPESGAEERRLVVARVQAGQPSQNLESVRMRKDGSVFPVSVTVSPIRDENGTISGMSAFLLDMTEQKQAAENARSLVAAEDLIRIVMASASVGMGLASLDGSFQVVNAALCDLLGHDPAWFLGHHLRDIGHPEDVAAAMPEKAQYGAGTLDKMAGQARLLRADGTVVWVRRVTVLIRNERGEPNLLLVQFEDITAEHEAHEELAFQAFHDPLTGLHNRAWILDILEVDLTAAQRLGTAVGALFIDLDNFKVVNDSLGHAAGDEVLATVAARIVSALGPGDRVGRFGGDEFIVLVQDVHEGVDVEHRAEQVSAAISADLEVYGHRIVPTASIGIATSTPTSTPDSLLRDADSALFRAKSAGRDRWQFFDAVMHAHAVARLTIEDQLRSAITGHEFVVHYQPIVALADGRVVGHEALVRWVHPTRGLLSPADFLDVAEDTGLITAIGAQVLDQVCALLAQRPDLPGPISVNVSAVQLAASHWLEGVRETLSRHGVDASRIVVEVTETAVLSMVDSAKIAALALRRLGVGIHVDDFGTGYSSISVLRDLPVTGVKLDLRFVRDLTAGDSQANALAQGLSGLVEGMHLTGIAEGVETQLQADILRAQGWDFGQGYYFGRPGPIPVTP